MKRWWFMARATVASILRRRGEEEQLAADLRFHLEQATAEYMQRGLSADEARRAALMAFGNPTRVIEEVREVSMWMWWDHLAHDVRSACRALRRTPGFTATAVLILALGIGATAAIFSVANAVLFRPLPFVDPARLVQFGPIGVLEFQAYREHGRSFETLVSWQTINTNLEATGGPERISAIAAERGLFDLLGVRPLAGRTFAPGDPASVAVVSEGFWRRHFGGTRSLNDATILLDQRPYTIVGVMPEAFQFPYRTAPTEIWLPADLPQTDDRSRRIDVAVGRLGAGVTPESATAELKAIAERVGLRRASSQDPAVTMTPLTEAVVGRSRLSLLTLLGAVAMVLLIACANVANLLLVRAEGRRRDVAVRTALGAGRGRLIAQSLAEGLVLAILAGVGAVVVALALTGVLATVAAAQIPRAFEIGLDWTTFLFLVLLAAGAGVAFGIVLAAQATTSDISGALNGTSAGGARARGRVAVHNGLVVAEVAFAMVLLTGAGLLLRAFVLLEAAPTGIIPERVLTLRLETLGQVSQQRPAPETDGGLSPQGRYFAAIEDRVRQIAGVRTAGFVSRLHVQSPGNTGVVSIAGRPAAPGADLPVRLREATPGYFQALGIPLRAGRLFAPGEPGLLVNEALVRQYFAAGVDPIGRVLSRGTIVGVVGDVRQRLRLPAEPEIYTPLARTGYMGATLVASVTIPPAGVVGPIRAAIREINPHQAVFDVKTMEAVITASHADLSLSLWVIGAFAVLALGLSVAGIYGVVAYAAAARRKEFGIRVALGADAGRVFRLVMTQGGALIGTGVLIGTAGALVLTRSLQALLYEVTPADPLTFAMTTLLLAGVGLFACLNPARRAMKVDPLATLRHE